MKKTTTKQPKSFVLGKEKHRRYMPYTKEAALMYTILAERDKPTPCNPVS